MTWNDVFTAVVAAELVVCLIVIFGALICVGVKLAWARWRRRNDERARWERWSAWSKWRGMRR